MAHFASIGVQAHDDEREEVSFIPLDFDPFSADIQTLGRIGEELALSYLESHGFELIQKRWTCPFGESDLICLDQNCLVFVEVKTRVTKYKEYRLLPELAVGTEKQKRYRALAEFYLSRYPHPDETRFDVIAIEMMANDGVTLQHFRSAFVFDE